MKRQADSNHRERCVEIVAFLIPALREVARRHGYALGVHGSLAYDIDLIACPWATHVTAPRLFAEAVGKAIHAVNGVAYDPDIDGSEDNTTHAEYLRNGCPGRKPHGRLVWVFHLGGGPYIDLSVMYMPDAPAPPAPKRGKRK